MYNLRIFSPNKSCAPLRNLQFNRRVFLRFGSTTPLVSKFKYFELNSIEGVRMSSNKIIMKRIFDEQNIHHSNWISSDNPHLIINFFNKYKMLIAKHKRSSQGKDIYYIDTLESLMELLKTVNIKDFVFEKYCFFPSEYRVHVDKDHGCFYACKKVLKEDAEVEWHKHFNNSTFVRVTEEHVLPQCWDELIKECQMICKAMNMHILCFDILCCDNDFIIVETNSAPALATYGLTYYSNHIQKYYGNNR